MECFLIAKRGDDPASLMEAGHSCVLLCVCTLRNNLYPNLFVPWPNVPKLLRKTSEPTTSVKTQYICRAVICLQNLLLNNCWPLGRIKKSPRNFIILSKVKNIKSYHSCIWPCIWHSGINRLWIRKHWTLDSKFLVEVLCALSVQNTLQMLFTVQSPKSSVPESKVQFPRFTKTFAWGFRELGEWSLR